MDKDTKRLMKEITKQGFTITTSRKGYPMVYGHNGEFVTQLAQTTSDWRSRRNAIAALRRHGFTWPPKR